MPRKNRREIWKDEGTVAGDRGYLKVDDEQRPDDKEADRIEDGVLLGGDDQEDAGYDEYPDGGEPIRQPREPNRRLGD